MSLLPTAMPPENVAIGHIELGGNRIPVMISHQMWLLLYNIVRNSIGTTGSIPDQFLELLQINDDDIVSTDAIQDKQSIINSYLLNEHAPDVYPLPLDVSNALQLAISAGLLNDNTPTQALDVMSSPKFVALLLGARLAATPVSGLIEYDGNIVYSTNGSGRRASLQRTLFTQTQAVTVANTGAETTLIGTGVGSVTLPANYAIQGREIRIEGWGIHSAVSNPTIRIRVYKGSTLLLDTTAQPSGNSTNALFRINADLIWYSPTSVWAQGFYKEEGGGASASDFPMINTSAVTVNTNSEALNITVQWGATSPSDTLTLTNLSIRECN